MRPALALALAACAAPAFAAPLLSEIPGWPGERPEEVLGPIVASCAALRDAPDWAAGCAAAAGLAARLPLLPAQERAPGVVHLLGVYFTAAAPAAQGLLTGYYEPELRGALVRGGAFQVPLLALPDGPGPWPDRAAIEDGALDGIARPLVFVDDPVDAFFLHIQGSGRIRLPDGRVLRLGYAGQNGHPYRAIGRALIERGEIAPEAMSMQAIRGWLAAAPPAAAAALMRGNPSFIFFRVLAGLDPGAGPLGAQGVPLTPGRSLAVDPALVPYGAPVFLRSAHPLTGAPLLRLVVAQDTGGAIRGPGRGDLFWGWGPAAAAAAGAMRAPGELIVLRPRPGAGPHSQAARPGL